MPRAVPRPALNGAGVLTMYIYVGKYELVAPPRCPGAPYGEQLTPHTYEHQSPDPG